MDEKRRAVHEAGHLILAISYGWPIVEINLDGGGANMGVVDARPPEYSGFISRSDLSESEKLTLIEQTLIQLAAGGAAEEIILSGDAQGCNGGSQSDFGKFHSLVNEVGQNTNLNLRLFTFEDAKLLAKLTLGSHIYYQMLMSFSDFSLQNRKLDSRMIADYLSRFFQNFQLEL
ncbi:hypothetical protein [Deinococcus sp.]|uniref:hypothetical protein n=1 Tax=Deinococcus sp. TaxID=47478 RepID=UPI003C7E9B60